MTTYPGDDLVPDPLLVIDRSATFPVTPEALWPWIVQIGKGRAGWYMPRAVERLVPPARRGLRRIDPALQDVAAGTEAGDWGPGDPRFRCVEATPASALVWLSLRDTSAGHGWPVDPASPTVLAFSWALLLRPDAGGGTHLHIRLRMTKDAWRSDPLFRVKRPFFDLFDYLTIVALFAGLRERVIES